MASETTITVRRTANSTPLRKFDYDAWYGDIDLGVTVGHGATPNEAIQDLEGNRDELKAYDELKMAGDGHTERLPITR